MPLQRAGCGPAGRADCELLGRSLTRPANSGGSWAVWGPERLPGGR